jgi:similar to spore coat protein
MNSIIESLTGMNTMTDQIIATDLLIAAKTGVRNYAIAVTDVATPEVRAALLNQLRESINMHEEITNYMMDKGWYRPYNAREQIRLDVNNGQRSLDMAEGGLPIL